MIVAHFVFRRYNTNQEKSAVVLRFAIMLSLSLVLRVVVLACFLVLLCAASSFDADDIGKCCGYPNELSDETVVDCTFRSNPARVCRV